MLLALSACGGQPSGKSVATPIPVEIQTISSCDNLSGRSYVGVVVSEVAVPLRFTLGGTLTAVYVHNGQRVRKGDLLAQVDDTQARSMHESAMATLRQAEDGYNRLKKVYDQGGVTEVRWVQMETDLAKARNAEIMARQSLENCSLRAPRDGVVSGAEAPVGTDMAPMAVFASILDLSQMMVEFSVAENDINQIKPGLMAVATFPAEGQQKLSVKVTDKSLIANPMGHTYKVKARILDADRLSNSLMPGMVAKVNVGAIGRAGVVIPASCVQTVQNGLSVWVVRDSVADRRLIEVGEYVQNGVLVTEGLHDGEIVVVEGGQKLYTGAKVRY
ncbi:MAG: efflux RND transporter periplasmic adaptor subunit [Paludibacteraceae bacterium]|nr:efflux RND transporter periplasmic adaptor subunit [Paludibacteraceae bacterium]